MTQAIHNRAILTRMSIDKWNGTREDKAITGKVHSDTGAEHGSGKWVKSLIHPKATVGTGLLYGPDNILLPGTAQAQGAAQKKLQKETNSYQRLMSAIAAMYLWNSSLTLPWNNSGERILPMGLLDQYQDGIRERFAELDDCLDEFVRDYPALVESSRTLHNGSFNPKEYPDPSMIRSKFKWKIDYLPVPSGGDFRVELTEDELRVLASSTERRVQEIAAQAQAEAVRRLYEAVERIHSGLSESDPNRKDGFKTFRDTLVENARDLCAVLGHLNITGDPRLDKFRRDTELLAASEPDTLRDVPAVRVETAQRAQTILSDMLSAFGPGTCVRPNKQQN
jgi:hypothetical protein